MVVKRHAGAGGDMANVRGKGGAGGRLKYDRDAEKVADDLADSVHELRALAVREGWDSPVGRRVREIGLKVDAEVAALRRLIHFDEPRSPWGP